MDRASGTVGLERTRIGGGYFLGFGERCVVGAGGASRGEEGSASEPHVRDHAAPEPVPRDAYPSAYTRT